MKNIKITLRIVQTEREQTAEEIVRELVEETIDQILGKYQDQVYKIS
jgi:16S rRNA C1402 N4-methylase RsmH